MEKAIKHMKCLKCGKEKEISHFLFSKRRNKSEGWCRSCRTEKTLLWRRHNIVKHREYDANYKRNLWKKNPFKMRISNMRASACTHSKILKLPFEIKSPDLINIYNEQKGKCYYTGLEMSVSGSRTNDLLLMSCDRIDSTKGYVKGNVVLCCFGINMLKSKLPVQDMFTCLEKFFYGAVSLGNINPPRGLP